MIMLMIVYIVVVMGVVDIYDDIDDDVYGYVIIHSYVDMITTGYMCIITSSYTNYNN